MGVLPAAPALAAGPLAAEIDIVHFDEADEALRGISLHHHLGEFVLELPGCGLSNAEPAAELEGGDGLLCVMWYMARNQVLSASLVLAKIVPAVREAWWWHSEH